MDRDVSWQCLQRESENKGPKCGLVLVPPLLLRQWICSVPPTASHFNPGEQRRGRKLLIHLFQSTLYNSLRKNYGK